MQELDDEDIVSITYNGRTVETRAGNLTVNVEKDEANKLRKPSMKQMARSMGKGASSISGAKRKTTEDGSVNSGKKQCMIDEDSNDMVEGASPQVAPQGP